MRILHVIPFFTPAMGGSAQVAYQMARHLGERGHDVTVVTSDYGIQGSGFPSGPFEVELLPCVARWGFYVTPGLPRWAARNLGRFDVIHLHELRTYQNAVVSRHAVRQRIPYVLSAHGTLPVIVQRQAAKRAYDVVAGRRLLAQAGKLVAVSEFEAGQYRDAGIDESRISVVYNGLDLAEYADLPPLGESRRFLGVTDPDTSIVLYLGRIHQRKGIDHLVEAFGRLRDQARAVLVIAGPDHGEGAHLQELAARLGLAEQVHFTGPLYGRDKLAALVAADVLASPGVFEIFGLVPFEALMCGTPVIVTDDCGSGQLIHQARAGYLVSYGDSAALADAILEALGDPAEAQRRVAAGQAFVRERLSWDSITTELEQLYAARNLHAND